MKKPVAVLIAVLLLVGAAVSCNPSPSGISVVEKKRVSDDVHVSMQIGRKDQKTLLGEQYTFVYFKYTISNQRRKGSVHFHPGQIRVKYNGFVNESTEYDSLASAMTESVELPQGVSDHLLYLVFRRPNLRDDVVKMEILDTGISMDARR